MLLEHVKAMMHSPVRNYAIPGLTSWLVGAKAPNGSLVRLFHCDRNHQEPITPHSHRFDFHAQVLQGRVVNRVWQEASERYGDMFCESTEEYKGEIGQYETKVLGHSYYRFDDQNFVDGDEYFMGAHEIHSIFFAKDTYVLMFEGPTVTTDSLILEPVVNGERIPTFKVQDWMFKRGVPFVG